MVNYFFYVLFCFLRVFYGEKGKPTVVWVVLKLRMQNRRVAITKLDSKNIGKNRSNLITENINTTFPFFKLFVVKLNAYCARCMLKKHTCALFAYVMTTYYFFTLRSLFLTAFYSITFSFAFSSCTFNRQDFSSSCTLNLWAFVSFYTLNLWT